MLKKSFFNRSEPAAVALMCEDSIERLIVRSRMSESEGADGIAIELAKLPIEARTAENFRLLMSSVQLPFMLILYRNDHWLGADDAARQKFLLTAAEAGAEVIDVMGDLFDPAPLELTHDAGAIEKQKKLIEEIHARGAKVIMSSHMSQQARSAEEVLAHLREQAARGADMLKIVTGVNTPEELTEAFRTTMLLHRELDRPFVHLCGGLYARPHRYMGGILGSAISFAVPDYADPCYAIQPTIRSLKAVWSNLTWRISGIPD